MPSYGTIAAVKAKLQPTDDAVWPASLDGILGGIQAAVSAAIEEDVGRTFGATAADTAQLIYAGPSATLLLPIPARSIASVTVGGSVAGGTATGGTLYASDLWEHHPVDRNGLILGIRLASGGYWGWADLTGTAAHPVVVVGDFADSDDDESVPDDITEVANYLTAETYKAQSASPAGFIGPDGSVVPIRNPWSDPLVTRVLTRYRIVNRVPAF